MQYPIYLDYNASTPIDPKVLEAMSPQLATTFGNASSIDHHHGARAAHVVENARCTIAKAIAARPEEIVFTSGATESNNLALIGVMEANEERGNHLITCCTEHPSILQTALYLKSRGKLITILEVDRKGVVDPEELERAITPRTVLISIMTANNEIGTIAPIADIGRIAHEREILFHTDATQALGHMEVNVRNLEVDLMSFSSHKMYGPKGVGALYIRRRNPFVRVSPLIHGGGHERGIRSGTVNAPAIVGFEKAVQICHHSRRSEQDRLECLGNSLLTFLLNSVPGVELNGAINERLKHCINLFIPGIENKALIVSLKDKLSISAGSACATNQVSPSHVLQALGFADTRSYSSIRISIGRFTTEEEIDYAKNELALTIKALRESFPSGTPSASRRNHTFPNLS